MRKLAMAALSFAAAVFAANYILPVSWLPLCAALLAVTGTALLFMRRKWLRGIIITLLGCAFGLSCFYIHYRRTTLPVRALEGTTTEISGVLTEYPQEYDEYCRAVIKLDTEGLPHLKAVLYDNSMGLAGAEPGQRISAEARLSAADTRYGESYDYYNSRDIYLFLNANSEVRIASNKTDLTYLPVRMSHQLSQLCDKIFLEDTAAFMKSLMLGDKSGLYEDEGLYLALSRAGLMHIVAVSGMHIAFLVSLLQLLLGHGRKSSVVCILLIWLFVLITGAGPSAVRAGVMQSLLLTAPVLRRENDPVTSLSAALALILLFNPYAAASISLQLSFAAMAGILMLSERISGLMLSALPEGKVQDLLRYPAGIAASSVSVMAFTVPLSAIHFGYVALLSPIANILVLWLVSVCFCGAYMACALAAVTLPLGAAAAWLVSWPVRAIFLCARGISAVPFAAVYLQGPLIGVWLFMTYALFILAALSRTKAGFKILFPVTLSAVALALNLGLTKLNYESGSGVITVLNVGQGQCISVLAGDKTMVIDCGGLWSPDNAGETAGAYLKSRGREGIDVLLLTHLHADHANGVTMLMEMADVKLLLMPENPSDDDGLLEGILRRAERHGTEVRYITEDEHLTVGKITAMLYAPAEKGGMNERCVMAKVTVGDYDMLVTADAPKSAERELVETQDIRDVELLIAGHHGSRYASSGELLGSIGADTAIISVGYNTFGHPTYETLERLAAYGYNIYRTDINGTIEIRIG